MKAGDTVSYIICQVKMAVFIQLNYVAIVLRDGKRQPAPEKKCFGVCSDTILQLKRVNLLY